MGLFGIKGIKIDPGKTLKNLTSIKGVTKELNNASRNFSPLHQYTVEPLLNGKKDDAPKPGEDPNVTALRKKLYGEAVDFDQSLPGMQSQASEQIGKEGGLALDAGIKDTRQNYNRRGLLYSGLREGGEQGVRGKVASSMANQKAQSNQELTKLAQAKYQKAAQVGLQGYQDAVNREAEIAGINLQNQVARAQAMQQLSQTVGYGAGSYYGSRTPSAPQASGSGKVTPYVGDYNHNPNLVYS